MKERQGKGGGKGPQIAEEGKEKQRKREDRRQGKVDVEMRQGKGGKERGHTSNRIQTKAKGNGEYETEEGKVRVTEQEERTGMGGKRVTHWRE